MEWCSQRKEIYLQTSKLVSFLPSWWPNFKRHILCIQTSHWTFSLAHRHHPWHFPLVHAEQSVNIYLVHKYLYKWMSCSSSVLLSCGSFFPWDLRADLHLLTSLHAWVWLYPICINCLPFRSVSSCRRCTGGRLMKEPWRRPSNSICYTNRSNTIKFSNNRFK